MIQINHLNITRNHHRVLDDISLEISSGEFVLLTGPSGCGKTTLALAITGLIPQAIPADVDGKIFVNGVDPSVSKLPEISQKVGIVFQNPSTQLFHLHVEDEIAFGPRNLGLCEEEVQGRVQWALNVTNLNTLRYRKPAELSGGQKQCVAIASVLAMQPETLILDEPTASLDIPNSRLVLSTLEKLNKELNTTILLIEHRFNPILRKVHHVVIMETGKIIAEGTDSSILSDTHIQKTLGIRRPADKQPQNWESLINEYGKKIKQGTPILEFQHVFAGYNHKDVLHDINFRIFPKDFIAFVGNNGAGKSTLARVAAGLLKPSKGKVIFNGGMKNHPGLDIALLFQNPSEQLFTDSVDAEIAYGPTNYEIFDPIFHEEILEKADLLLLRDYKPFRLSMGQQQRTALAATLSSRPKLLILDEPTLGQDWGHLQKLMNFLVQINKEGTAIILITHDYKLIHHYAQRIFIISDGTISLEGKIVKLRRELNETIYT